MKPETINFEKPVMSWEKPIEQEILRYVRDMANQMESASAHHRETGWFANNSLSDQLKAEATAFRMVEKYILREIELRLTINKN